MIPIIVLARWRGKVRWFSGYRSNLPDLLRRCRGAVQVSIYEEKEVIYRIEHVRRALEDWTSKGGRP